MKAVIDGTMVDFMCQIDWDKGWPGVWSNMTLGVFVRVFLDVIDI